MRLEEFVQQELRKLPPDRSIRWDTDRAWIRCPVHNNGNERTGSMRIMLKRENTPKGVVYPGHIYCWGCGKTHPWDVLVERYKLKKIKRSQMYNDSAYEVFSPEDRAAMLGEAQTEQLPVDAAPWPVHMNWRNINGQTTHDVGGLIYYDYGIKQTRCILPVNIHEEMVGFVKCNLMPVKKGRNYFNSTGSWSRTQALFPYDHVKEMLDKKRPRIIYLVEGPRDALNQVQLGKACLAILGARNWTDEKRELVLDLDPDLVVVMLDPDKVGQLGAAKIVKSLKRSVPIVNFKFPLNPDGSKKMDASDLTKKQSNGIHRRYLDRLKQGEIGSKAKKRIAA